MVKSIPDDYPRVSPMLCADGANDAIEFYQSVFGANTRLLVPMADGKVAHCELEIGDSLLMIADEFPEMGFLSPKSIGGTPVNLSIYVEDVDATFAAALAAGATETQPVQQQFYGDRSGQFVDPWGHRWNIATHTEDVDPEELARRSKEMMG